MTSRNKVVRGEEVPPGGEGDTKGIPGFWAQVLSSHEVFEDVISDKDKEVLKALQEVRVERSEDTQKPKLRHVVKLVFLFSENPFFSETELTKAYYFYDQDEHVADHSEGCKITWKEGVLLTLVLACLATPQSSLERGREIHVRQSCTGTFSRQGQELMGRGTRAGKDATKKYMKKKDNKGGWKHKVTDVPSVFSFFSPPSVPKSALSEDEQEALEEVRLSLPLSAYWPVNGM